ncbi:hypothetical protein MIT9_P0437 [Methylomarinovum caldicuralii]|uniref:Smr domain-containing protein n=1 Tax=Methylomarinovum caldicuralii TaxID=438856 RepID=A0AAU9C1A0_9GAMM|nr:DNA endonuclease SmrA [Methylomarinovum caldicuralii]BCX80859.1 hypothetical protein MIT9_P0437 [Methylomarinovum caldicuralii]
MTDEEDELFRAAMADARPLRCDKVPLRRAARPTPGQDYRREAARRQLDDPNFLPTSFIEPLPPHAILEYRRPGLQDGVFRKLRRGEYPVEALLDLHAMTVEQARREVYHFVQTCLQQSVRCALIIHGKGTPQSPGLLKGCLLRWLPLLPEVMAFHSASRHHGGSGALYVLLRKSELEKERNRRRYQLAER